MTQMTLPNTICTATLIIQLFSLLFCRISKALFSGWFKCKTNFLAESQNGGRRGTTKPSTKGGECLFLALYNKVQWVGKLSEAFIVLIFVWLGFYKTFVVSICAWFLKYQFGSLLQTQKKNRFGIKLDFFSSSNLIFTACVACKNQFRNQIDFLTF